MTDTERMNWLEAHSREFFLRTYNKRWACTPMTNYKYNTYPTIREAIDAAMDGSWNLDKPRGNKHE